jgi:hypothetical protein
LNAARKAGDSPHGQGPDQPPMQSVEPSPDLLSALAGREANREVAVGHRTRRVVLSSLGVLREQKKNRSRARGLALAAAIVVPLLIAPLVWEATDSFIAGEHLGDPGSQLSLWAAVFCCTLLAAVLGAGWWKNRA